MATTNVAPRIRTDLRAAAAEDEGVRYFDISDPRSGARMRMYDFEWLIATRMDGARRFDNLARWAQDELGIKPSGEDIAEYARRLEELGFFDADGPAAASVVEIEADSFSPDVDIEEVTTPLAKSPPIAAAPSLTPAPFVPAPPPVAPPPSIQTQPTLQAPAPTLPAQPPPRAFEPRVNPSPLMPQRSLDEGAGTGTGKMTAVGQEPASSSSSAVIVVILVALLAAGGVGYYKLKLQGVHVTTQTVSPHELTRTFKSTASIAKGDAESLSFGEPGKVVDAVAANTEVQAGQAIATLDAYAKLEKELSDVKDRAHFYEKQVETAKAKGVADEVSKAEAKVNEKKKLLVELENKVGKTRITAPSAGTVTQVLVQVGADAKAGEAAVKFNSTQLTAVFTLPSAEATTLKVGQETQLQGSGGLLAPARVAKLQPKGEQTAVVVELTKKDLLPKLGGELRLVRDRQASVTALVPGAVSEQGGASVVYVVEQGVARRRPVTVLERTDGEVLISDGLRAGESVITSGLETIQDGQRIAQE